MPIEVITPTTSELMWRNCQRLLLLNPLVLPTYYTTLFNAFKSLISMFSEEDYNELLARIAEVEKFISDDLNPLSLQEAEMRMYNNLDLLSGFQVNGQLITQYEINAKLEEIKTWLNQLLYEYLPHIRFTTQVRVD